MADKSLIIPDKKRLLQIHENRLRMKAEGRNPVLYARWPYYELVPKDMLENLDFRERIVHLLGRRPALRQQFWNMCARDILFWVNSTCIAAGTLVVTKRGPVPIEQVRPADLVWDGVEWVNQRGSIFKGIKPVIKRNGVRLTSDHKVWTDHGWQEAVSGYDWKEIRLPDGYPSRRKISRNQAGRMAVPVLLWPGNNCLWKLSAARDNEKLRLHQGKEAGSWNVWNSGMENLAVDEGKVQKGWFEWLRTLWRAWNNCLRPLEPVRELLCGHGDKTSWHLNRPDRQQCRVQSGKLPVGNSETAGEQHSKKRPNPDIARELNDPTGGKDSWPFQERTEAQDGDGIDGRPPACSSRSGSASVYDLINCGPRRCFTILSEDGTPFLVHNCWIHEPRPFPKDLAFVTYPFQDEAITDVIDSIGKRDLILEKSRDMGASWICLAAMTWLWQFGGKYRGRYSFKLLSRKEELVDSKDDPDSLFWKVDFLRLRQQSWMVVPANRTSMHLSNLVSGAVFDGESTNKYAGVGGRRTAMLMDEFSKMENQGAIFTGTRDVSPSRLFVYTPQGSGNTAYDIAHSGKIKKITLHWTQHPIKAKGLYFVDDRGTGGGIRFPQGRARSPWYDEQCERANLPQEIAQELDIDYLGSDTQFFENASLNKMMDTECKEPLQIGDFLYDSDTGRPTGGFVTSDRGRLRLWCNLQNGAPAANTRYVLGIDISEGVGDYDSPDAIRSNSVISVGDLTTGEQVAEFAAGDIQPYLFSRYAVALARWFVGTDGSPAFMVWEKNGPGAEFGKEVVSLGFRNFYYKTDIKSMYGRVSDQPGWHSNKESKRTLLGLLSKALKERSCIIRSAQMIREARQYIFTTTGSIVFSRAAKTEVATEAGDSHGDRVIAAALMNMAYTERPVKGEAKVETVNRNCFAYRRAAFEKKSREKVEW